MNDKILKEYTKDTAAEYDDLVGYVADENITDTLGGFLGEEAEEYKPQVNRKKVDAEFPEDWQTLFVNFLYLICQKMQVIRHVLLFVCLFPFDCFSCQFLFGI